MSDITNKELYVGFFGFGVFILNYINYNNSDSLLNSILTTITLIMWFGWSTYLVVKK
jgi:hypothetical protein